MELIYHDESFDLNDIEYPLKDIHIIDNYLSSEIHHWVDTTLHTANIWSKTNLVKGDMKTGLPHHELWGATLINRDSYPHAYHELYDWLGVKCVAEWLNSKLQMDFGFKWERFQYMGLNSQTQGLHGTTHADCDVNDEWNLSFLYYTNKFWEKHWGGPLRIYDEMQQGLHGRDNHIKNHQIAEIEFKPNRLVMFDGRTPHGADAPTPEARYMSRKSIVIRGDEIRLVKDKREFF
jgi:hypothetical protein